MLVTIPAMATFCLRLGTKRKSFLPFRPTAEALTDYAAELYQQPLELRNNSSFSYLATFQSE